MPRVQTAIEADNKAAWFMHTATGLQSDVCATPSKTTVKRELSGLEEEPDE